MAPPPSQAGKFKPRKPGKKIAKPGQPVGSSQTPEAARSSSAPGVAARGSSHHAGRSNEARGGGRGRGRRGGGRGRIPLPRGQVFFTGQPDPKQAGGARKRSAAPAGAAGRGTTPSARPGSNEEIVGTLDQGVGSGRSKSSSKGKLSTSKRDDNDFHEEDERAPTTNIKASAAYYSDSDSSADERVKSKSTKHQPLDENDATEPMSLPFPEQDAVKPTSFFGQEDRDGGWFLMQLPTRLLQFTKQDEVEEITDGKDDAEVEVLAGVETAPVSTKPIASGVFDNVLSKAPPGRLGKLRVYKSGRTELVLGDGVVLDVSEGLTCGFQQQAVAVDLDNARFVPMGQVKETFVATPNIE